MEKYETRLYDGNKCQNERNEKEKRSSFVKVLAVGAVSFGIGVCAGYSEATEMLDKTAQIIEQRQNEIKQNNPLSRYTTDNYKNSMGEDIEK